MFCFLSPSNRERKRKGGKSDDKKKRKSAGQEKERERATGNDSFKSREFISSEDSSSESDRGKKGRKRKVAQICTVMLIPNAPSCVKLHNTIIFITEHNICLNVHSPQ